MSEMEVPGNSVAAASKELTRRIESEKPDNAMPTALIRDVVLVGTSFGLGNVLSLLTLYISLPSRAHPLWTVLMSST